MGIFVVRARHWRDAASYDFGVASLATSVMRPLVNPGVGGVYLDEEDPYVWLDRRGRLHAVVHMFLLGGHMASDDGGHSWHWFGPTTGRTSNATDAENQAKSTGGAAPCPPVAVTGTPGGSGNGNGNGNGSGGAVEPGPTQLCFQRRERPHLVFDARGRGPVAATFGVVWDRGDDYCWTMAQPTALWSPQVIV